MIMRIIIIVHSIIHIRKFITIIVIINIPTINIVNIIADFTF